MHIMIVVLLFWHSWSLPSSAPLGFAIAPIKIPQQPPIAIVLEQVDGGTRDLSSRILCVSPTNNENKMRQEDKPVGDAGDGLVSTSALASRYIPYQGPETPLSAANNSNRRNNSSNNGNNSGRSSSRSVYSSRRWKRTTPSSLGIPGTSMVPEEAPPANRVAFRVPMAKTTSIQCFSSISEYHFSQLYMRLGNLLATAENRYITEQRAKAKKVTVEKHLEDFLMSKAQDDKKKWEELGAFKEAVPAVILAIVKTFLTQMYSQENAAMSDPILEDTKPTPAQQQQPIAFVPTVQPQEISLVAAAPKIQNLTATGVVGKADGPNNKSNNDDCCVIS